MTGDDRTIEEAIALYSNLAVTLSEGARAAACDVLAILVSLQAQEGQTRPAMSHDD